MKLIIPKRGSYAPAYPRRLNPCELPRGHPCRNCTARSAVTDKPYCFLPVCRQDFFEKGAKYEATK